MLELVRQFRLSAGELARQLGGFRRTAEVRVVVHVDIVSSFHSMRADGLQGTTREPGRAYETHFTAGGMIEALRGRPERMPIFVTAYSSTLWPRIRTIVPRSLLGSGCGGAVAEIHADLGRYMPLDDPNMLRIEIDLDRPYEAAEKYIRNDAKPLMRIG